MLRMVRCRSNRIVGTQFHAVGQSSASGFLFEGPSVERMQPLGQANVHYRYDLQPIRSNSDSYCDDITFILQLAH